MAYKAKPLPDRFWPHVNKNSGIFRMIDGSLSECWVWTGSIDHKGYGYLTDEGGSKDKPAMKIRAHRAAWKLADRAIPDGFDLCHKCDNRPCVRLHHLFPGTRKLNINDAKTKGWLGSGDAVRHSAKLTWEQVRMIRLRYASGESRKTLRADFGVSKSQIRRIVLEERWRD